MAPRRFGCWSPTRCCASAGPRRPAPRRAGSGSRLKDPRVLPQTVVWMSNGGRDYAPWNGRHRRAIGLEEICGYFHLGHAASLADNPVAAAGSPTAVTLDPGGAGHGLLHVRRRRGAAGFGASPTSWQRPAASALIGVGRPGGLCAPAIRPSWLGRAPPDARQGQGEPDDRPARWPARAADAQGRCGCPPG